MAGAWRWIRLSPGNRRDSVEGSPRALKGCKRSVYLPAIAGTPLKVHVHRRRQVADAVYLPAIAGTPLKGRRCAPASNRPVVYLPAIAGTPLKVFG